MSMFQRRSLLSKVTDQLKSLKKQLEGLVECENDVARALLKWSYDEENRSLGMVFSCLADLTYGHTMLIGELCKKHVTYRQIFKKIIEEENALERVKDEKIRCEGKVLSTHKKLETLSQKNKRDETKVQIAQAELQEVVKRSTEATSLYETKLEEFEYFKAESIRNALIYHNSGCIETLSNMQIIYQTKKDIAETLSEQPQYTIEENDSAENHRIVKNTLENMRLSIPPREPALDRFQMNRGTRPVRSASPSPALQNALSMSSLHSPPSSPKPSPLSLNRSQTDSQLSSSLERAQLKQLKLPPPTRKPPLRSPPGRPLPQLPSTMMAEELSQLDSDSDESDSHDYNYIEDVPAFPEFQSDGGDSGEYITPFMPEVKDNSSESDYSQSVVRMPPGHEMGRLPPNPIPRQKGPKQNHTSELSKPPKPPPPKPTPTEYLDPKQSEGMPQEVLPLTQSLNEAEDEPFYFVPPSDEPSVEDMTIQSELSDNGHVPKKQTRPPPSGEPSVADKTIPSEPNDSRHVPKKQTRPKPLVLPKTKAKPPMPKPKPRQSGKLNEQK